MAFELKPNSGTLFKNDKDGNDKRPDYRGELKLESGEILKLAGWIKQGQKGAFLSLSVDKPREDREAVDNFRQGSSGGVSGGNRPSQGSYDLNDDIPF